MKLTNYWPARVLFIALVIPALSHCGGQIAVREQSSKLRASKVEAKEIVNGENTEIEVVVVGDIMLAGTATPELNKFGYDYPFEDVKHLLKDADLVFGNLEGPLTLGGTPFKAKKYLFRSPPDKVAPALARAGIDIVSLANNHIMDYGKEGLNDTLRALDNAGIANSGAGRDSRIARQPAILKRKDKDIAVLSYSLTYPEEFWASSDRPGTAFGHEVHIREDIARAKSIADIVLVSFHWGRESTTELRPYQSYLGRVAIDVGATAVIGHHPHVLQGVEQYKEGVILYSLGNFVFGSYSKKAQRSVVARLTISDGRLKALKMTPINVNNVEVVFQPRILRDKDAEEVISHLRELSKPLNTSIVKIHDEAELELKRRLKVSQNRASRPDK